MSKMNKIITNNSVQLSESEINNLIVTLGPVIETFTGGGGQGSVIYTPGDDNISINNTQHTIALSTDAATKLNTPIPTKVSDLTDSASYATVDAINTKLDKDEFAAVSGDFATEQYVQAASAEVTGWVNNQNYLTQVPDTYYLKTETSGKDELSAAFDAILNYDVTAAAGIEITTATDNGTTTFGISMTAEPVVTDTNLSGYNGIAAAPDGAKSGWWNIGLTQDMLNTINGKLDSSDFTTYTGTTAPAAFQPKGDYATTQDISDMATKTWVGNQGFVTSGDITTPDTDYVMTTAGWKVLTLPGGGMTQVIHDTTLTGQGNADDSKLGVAWSALSGNTINSALSAGWAVSAEFAEKTWVPQGEGLPPYTANIGYNIKILHDFIDDIYLEPNWFPRETPIYADYAMSAYISENNVSGFNHIVNAINAKLDTTAAAQTYLSASTYATDSATFVTSSSNTITGTKQYALTNTGWTEVSTPTIPDITATNGISADGYNIGLTESVYSAIQEISAANDLVGANGISVVTGLNNQIIIEPSGISPSKQYAMTTTGWAEVQAGTTFTGVTTTGSISGDGLTNPLGLKTSAENALTAVAEKLDITAASQTYLDKTTYATDSATFVTSSNSTITGTDKYALTTTGWASVETAYLPLTGGTVTGQMTLTGTSWDNRLTIGRSNTAIDIGVALNGALTLKANANNACQFNMMQTGTSGVDINITYGQTPTAIGNLYVMKTHTTAEATTASGSWNGDNLLHIILDS